MVWLVFNADDFGLTEGVCAGIVRAMETGVLRSTTAMVCADRAPAHLQRWLPQVRGRVGLHLQLTDGTPCLPASDVPSLVQANGRFVGRRAELGVLEDEQIQREWDAQLERFRALGGEPSHLDSHHHVHLEAQVFQSFCAFARRHGLPGRTRASLTTQALRQAGVACLDRCELWQSETMVDSLLARIDRSARKLPRSAMEVMCHPAEIDTALRRASNYVDEREHELQVLTDPRLAQALLERGHQFVDMKTAIAKTLP